MKRSGLLSRNMKLVFVDGMKMSSLISRNKSVFAVRRNEKRSSLIHVATVQNPASVALRAPPQAGFWTSALVFIGTGTGVRVTTVLKCFPSGNEYCKLGGWRKSPTAA